MISMFNKNVKTLCLHIVINVNVKVSQLMWLRLQKHKVITVLLINYQTPANAILHIVFILKFTLKHLKSSYMFRSIDHPQGAYVVPC
jgi:hypothetical protein